MSSLAQNSPPRVKNTNTHFSGEKQNIYQVSIKQKQKRKQKRKQKNRTPPIKEKLTHIHSKLLQVPTTQLANMSIDPKFVELTANVHRIFL